MKAVYGHIVVAIFAVSGALTTQAARADVLFDNSDASISGGDYINTGSFLSGTNNGPLADSFSTGTSSFTLGEVQLNLGTGTGTGIITVDLMSDSSTLPGSVLETLGTISESSITGSTGAYALSAFSPYTLAAGTRYWIELTDSDTSTDAGSSATWNFAENDIGTDAGSTDLSDEYYLNSNNAAAQSDTSGPYVMTLSDGTTYAAPEPATLGILGMGLAGLRIVRRRRH